MSKLRLIWKGKAQRQKDAILAFFFKRNGSYAYSEKLAADWEHVLDLACEDPGMGQATKRKGIRRFVVGNYALLYRIGTEELTVEAVVDARRNVLLD